MLRKFPQSWIRRVLACFVADQLGRTMRRPIDENTDRMGCLVEFENSARCDAIYGASVVGDRAFVGEIVGAMIREALGGELGQPVRVWAGLTPERDQAVFDIEFRLVDEPVEMGRAFGEIVDENDARVHICMVSV